MDIGMTIPNTYQQWISCFEFLSKRTVSDEYIEMLKAGSCPGINNVIAQFLARLQETVNNMLNRSTRSCTKLLNESLEEGDFSNIEVILRRHYKEMMRCRFYLNISFIPDEYVSELDNTTVSEIRRYWKTMKKYFVDLTEETGNSDLYDMVYFIDRLVTKDK